MSNTVSPSYEINYISQLKKVLVGRNNNTIYQKFKIDNNIQDTYYFQLVSKNNQLVELSGFDYEFFGSYIDAKQYQHVLFYSDDFNIEDNVLSFKVNTYTSEYVNYVKVPKQIDISIRKKATGIDQVILRDVALAYPTPIYEGEEPSEVVAGFGLQKNGYIMSLTGTILSGDGTTIEINDNVISCIGGGGTEYTAGEGIGIDNNVISLTATIPSSVTQFDDTKWLIKALKNSNSITASMYSVSPSGSEWYVGIDYNSLHNAGFAYTSAIPLSTSQLTNDSGFTTNSDLSDYATKAELETVSGAIPTSYVTSSDLNNYATTGALNTVSSSIPTSTSQLTNDSNYATSSYVQSVSGTITGWVDEQDYADIEYVKGRVNISPIYNDTITHSQNNYILPYNYTINIYKTKHFAYSDGKVYINALTGGPSNNNAITIEHHIEGFDVGSTAFDGFVIDQNINVVGDLPSTFVTGTTYVFTRRLININNTTTEFISFAYSY